MRLVANLSESYRQVIMLVYMEDKSYDEGRQDAGAAAGYGEDVSAPRSQTTGYDGKGGG
jgi:hypothetical protein